MDTTTIIVAVIGSGALFTFIQFMISRHDNKNDKLKKLEDRFDGFDSTIKKVEDSINKLHQHIQTSISEVYNKIDDVYEHIDKSQAITARVRILRASDEIRLGTRHSKEYFDQLNDDITVYENYCRIHKDFKNNRAVQAIENINRVYQERLKDNNFL